MRQLIATLLLLIVACGGSERATTQLAAKPTMPSAPSTSEYWFLEPTGQTIDEGLPIVKPMESTSKAYQELERIMRRPFVQWVLQLGAESRRLGRRQCKPGDEECLASFDHPALFVVMQGGNRPKQGLAIQGKEGLRPLPRSWYVEVDPRRADLLIPHEYGHAIMFQVLPGDVPDHPSTLPHTTSAITNDVTAFTEGWGIHFETLAADRRETEGVFAQRHRDAFATNAPYTHGDSTLPAKDLLSYSQSDRRYRCIKDNCFAFLPRTRPEFFGEAKPTAEALLARWTDATYDPAQLRSLSQMVASEGVVAALFYRLGTAGARAPQRLENGDPPLPRMERYVAMLAAFQSLTKERLETKPAVLAFLEQLLSASPTDERLRIARAALEVLHYTPVFDDAQDFYAKLHAYGHVMNRDAAMALLEEKAPLMEAAVDKIVADPYQLSARGVSELWLLDDKTRLHLPVFGMTDIPLVFDLNTAPIEFLMALPRVGWEQAQAIRADRDRRGGFAGVGELESVQGLGAQVVEAAEAMRAAYLKSK